MPPRRTRLVLARLVLARSLLRTRRLSWHLARHLAPRLGCHAGRARARPHHDATRLRSLRRLLGERFCSRHLVRNAARGPESSEIKRTNQVRLQAKIAVKERFTAPAIPAASAKRAGSRWPTAPLPSSDCGAPPRARWLRPSRGQAPVRRG